MLGVCWLLTMVSCFVPAGIWYFDLNLWALYVWVGCGVGLVLQVCDFLGWVLFWVCLLDFGF